MQIVNKLIKAKHVIAFLSPMLRSHSTECSDIHSHKKKHNAAGHYKMTPVHVLKPGGAVTFSPAPSLHHSQCHTTASKALNKYTLTC